jgi:hypothetical protein
VRQEEIEVTTVISTVLPLVCDRRAQATVAVLAALVASLLLGAGEVAASWIKGQG